jgi:hypothetical protein
MFHAIHSELVDCPRSAAAGNAAALAAIGKKIAGSYMGEFDATMNSVRERLTGACVPEERVEGM